MEGWRRPQWYQEAGDEGSFFCSDVDTQPKIGRRVVEGGTLQRYVEPDVKAAEQQRRWADFEYYGNDVCLCSSVCRDRGGGVMVMTIVMPIVMLI